jgi:hypothetical protein
MIHVPYVAHIPFVLLFLTFALLFVIAQAVAGRK